MVNDVAGRNFGKNAHAATRKAHRAALKSASNEPAWTPPPESDWEADAPPHYYFSKKSRLVTRLAYYRGKIIDYAIMHEILIEGEWVDVFRTDCSHGTVHRHTGLPELNDNRDVIREIRSQDDIVETYESEYKYIYETRSKRETRWIT